jgi:hypothetical protein
MIRYYVLYKIEYGDPGETQPRIWQGCSLSAYSGYVDMWTARFRSGRISVEDDERPGRLFSDSLSDAVSGYLNRNPHASCRETVKDLFIPETTMLCILDQMGLRFFVAR